MTTYCFIEPLDVLYLRGNKLFGDPGSFGESVVPPWPSAAAGALRSALLVHKGIEPEAFARGEVADPELGTPSDPGPFSIAAFHLARRSRVGRVEPLFALPADLVIKVRDDDKIDVHRLLPHAPAHGLVTSAALRKLPVLAEKERGKAAGGYWLTHEGFQSYLRGETPRVEQLVETARLWRIDERVGVGLHTELRRADDGKLFSVQAVAPCRDVGFLVGVAGAQLPESAIVRFGGDGRAATLSRAEPALPQPDFEAICRDRRCRIVLSTPGIFAGGWKLPGLEGEDRFGLGGIRGHLGCAAVARAEVVSGFDLARWRPKPAQRAAPAGSVYWIEDLDATPEALRKLVETGLWARGDENPSRRAEGFNRFTFASY